MVALVNARVLPVRTLPAGAAADTISNWPVTGFIFLIVGPEGTGGGSDLPELDDDDPPELLRLPLGLARAGRPFGAASLAAGRAAPPPLAGTSAASSSASSVSFSTRRFSKRSRTAEARFEAAGFFFKRVTGGGFFATTSSHSPVSMAIMLERERLTN